MVEIWQDGDGGTAAVHDVIRRLRQEFGLPVIGPGKTRPDNIQVKCFYGRLVVRNQQYSPTEVRKTWRRVEDHVRKHDSDAIRVAKFLKLK